MQISVLGPLEAHRAGGDDTSHDQAVPLGGLRQRAVLARLAVAAGEMVPVDRVVDDLWDGDPPPSAVNTLQSYVSNLRRALRSPAGDAIERVGPGYRLAGVELVSQRFEQLVAEAAEAPVGERVALLDRALGLWRGPALADFADQPWAEAEAARLDELRLSAFEARCQALLDTGGHASAVGDLERAVADNPLREQLAAQLVLALYRSGRQADALRAYERTRAHLAEELGLDPMPELVELAARVLDQDPQLALAPATPAAPLAGPPPAPSAPPSLGDIAAPLPRAASVGHAHGLVGREQELARVCAGLDGLERGETRAVVVAGEAGVGKSALVAAAAAGVHEHGGLVLWGACAAEHLVAYQAVLDAVRAFERSLDRAVADALVERHPVLDHLLGRAGAMGAERDPYELYESVAGLLRDLAAGRPLVLVVDDLHWADRSSLSLLAHLLDHGRVPGLGVVGTVRRPAGRSTADLDRFVAELRRLEGTDVVELTGIDVSSVAELLDRCGHPVGSDVAEAVHARTGGNPLFVEALSSQPDDLTAADPRHLPHTVRETLDLRAAALDADDLHLLVTAAVLGDPVDLQVLADVCSCGIERVLDVVDVGVAAGLLVEDPEVVGRVSFSHGLVRDALIARSTRNREAQLHLRIADVLERRPAPVANAVLAQHLRAAGALCPPLRAATASVEAAQEAFDLLAPAEARTWARRSLQQLDTLPAPADGADEVRWRATYLKSQASRHLGDPAATRRAVDALLEQARASLDPVRLAHAAEEAVLATANLGFSFGTVDVDLVALLDEAYKALDAAPEDHPAEEAGVLAWSSIVLAGGPPSDRQRELAGAAAAAADRAGRPDARALGALARRLADPGPAGVDERLSLHDAMVADAAAARWTEMEVLALVMGVVDLLEADRVDESRQVLAALRTRLGPHERPGFDTYLLFLDAAFALLEGDLDRADERSGLGLAAGEAAHGTNATNAWAAEQYVLAWERGRLADFVEVTRGLVEEFPAIASWRAGHAAALVAAGDHAAALAAVEPLVDGDRLAVPGDSLWSTSVGMLAEVAWATGDARLGAVVAAAIEPVEHCVCVTGMGAVSLGHYVRHRGLALAAAGDLAGADRCLARAVERADASGFRTWAARARVERAEVLDRLGLDGSALRARGSADAEALGISLALGGPAS